MTLSEFENTEWLNASQKLLADPNSFLAWEDLVTAAENNKGRGITKLSSETEIELFDISYHGLLSKYPFLELYWVRYAETHFTLGNTRKAEEIFKRGVSRAPASLELWIRYLRFRVETIGDDLNGVLSLFEHARLKIGYHFHGHEFYKLYLAFLEDYSSQDAKFKKKFFVLLRIIIEIPLYHYDFFFRKFFSLFNEQNLSPEVLHYLIPKKEEANFAGQDLRSISVKLKKIFTEVYITTQYKVYELYQFERTLTRPYFHVTYLSNQELKTWRNYLNFVELNYPYNYTILCYERCLIATANYPIFRLRYSNYLICNKKLEQAKQLLYNTLTYMTDDKIFVKLVSLELTTGHFLKARDLVVSFIASNYNVPLSIYQKLLGIEALFSSNDPHYLITILRQLIQKTRLAWIFKFSIYMSLPNDLLSDLFNEFEEIFSSSYIYWSSFVLFSVRKGDDVRPIYEKAQHKLLPEEAIKLKLLCTQYTRLEKIHYAEDYDLFLQTLL